MRTITGLLRLPTGEPLANARIVFELQGAGYATDGQYPPRTTLAVTGSDGTFTVSLWPNTLGVVASSYLCRMPTGEAFAFILPEGSAITMTDLRALGEVDVNWNEKTLSTFALLKSANLSDVPDKPTALANLGAASSASLTAEATARANADIALANAAAADATAKANAAVAEHNDDALAHATELDARDTGNRARANHTGTQLAETISDFSTAADARITEQKAQPSGLASLDAGGKLSAEQLPDIAVSDYLGSVANQAAMLALVGQRGDWCTRSDLGTNFVITGADPTQLASWTQLNYPTAPVTSVAGKTGAVTLVVADIGGAVPSTRTLNATAPLRIGGGASADLSADRTLSVNAATDAAAGVVELATPTEVTTGTDTTRAVTPAGSKAALDAREALVLERLATREASGWLWSDGVTTNRAQIQIPGPRGNLAGAPLASWVGWVDVPSAAPTGTYFVAALSASNPAPAQNDVNSLYIAVGSDNSIQMTATGSPSSDFRRFALANGRVVYAGQRIWMDVRFTQGATNPVVRINGVDVSLSFAATSGGTPPAWLQSGLVATTHTTGFNWPVGPVPLGCWINAHLTDAESEAWRITGRPAWWVAFGGGMEQLISASQDRDFSGAGVGNWTVAIGAASTGNVANALDITFAASSAGGVRLQAAAIPNYLAGALVRVTFTASLVSGSTIVVRCGFNAGNEYAFTPTGSPTEYTADLIASVNNQLTFYTPASASQVVRIDNVSARYLGALSLPVPLPIAALGDGTVLGDNPARLVGIRPVTTRKDWQLTARTSTSGNEQILGGSFIDTTRDVLDSIEQTPESGTPTTTVGSASAGAQYKASGALAAGINTPALVTRKTASANLWVGSSTADPTRTTITGHSR